MLPFISSNEKFKTVPKLSDFTKVSEEKFSVFLSSQLKLFEFSNIKRIMPSSGHTNVQERTNSKFIFFLSVKLFIIILEACCKKISARIVLSRAYSCKNNASQLPRSLPFPLPSSPPVATALFPSAVLGFLLHYL